MLQDTLSIDSRPILYIGAALKDVVCHVDRIPLPGEGVVVSQRDERLGGCACNMAIISQYMDTPFELFIPLGYGSCAQFLSQELKRFGLSGTVIADAVTDNGECFCLVDSAGQRTMVTTPGIERMFEDVWFKDVDPSGYSFMVANGFEILGQGGPSILSLVERSDAQFVFAPGPCVGEVQGELRRRLRLLNPIWHLNDYEAAVFTGKTDIYEALNILFEESHSMVCITAGADGTYYKDLTGAYHIPTTPIVPIDTIGAGDSHLGTLLSMRVKGASWNDAIIAAHEVSSCICMTHGAICLYEEFPVHLRGSVFNL